MSRIDLTRLRKKHGMNQGELARELQVTQSFLSAIENGKSPLPPEKESRLLEIFGLDNLDDYIIDDPVSPDVSRKMSDMTDSDLFNQLLQRFHQQAHSKEGHHHHHDHHERIDSLQIQVEKLFERNENLMARNDRLAESCDNLRSDNDRLRKENDALRATADRLREEIDNLRTQIFELKNR